MGGEWANLETSKWQITETLVGPYYTQRFCVIIRFEVSFP